VRKGSEAKRKSARVDLVSTSLSRGGHEFLKRKGSKEWRSDLGKHLMGGGRRGFNSVQRKGERGKRGEGTGRLIMLK